MSYKGDFKENQIVEFEFSTNNINGGSVNFDDNPEIDDFILIKNSGTTERVGQSGWTLLLNFKGMVGIHRLQIDLSDNTDPGFYVKGNDYSLYLNPDPAETIDGEFVNALIGSFSIENRNNNSNLESISDSQQAAINLGVENDEKILGYVQGTHTLNSFSPIIGTINPNTLIGASVIFDSGSSFGKGVCRNIIDFDGTVAVVDKNFPSIPVDGDGILIIPKGNPYVVLSKYEGRIWFKNGTGNTNTIPGRDGTPPIPVSDWASINTLSSILGTKNIKVNGELTIGSISDSIFENWNIGETFDSFSTTRAKVIIPAGVAVSNSIFRRLEVEKNATGSLTNNLFDRCMIKGLSTQGIEGVYRKCSFDGGSYQIAGDTLIYKAYTMRGSKITFNMLPGIKNLKVFGLHFMDVEIQNHEANQVTIIEITSGRLTINSNCTGGNINVIGDPELINNSTGPGVFKTSVGVQNWSGEGVKESGANMIEDDGSGNKRWTEKALEQAPASDATLANQTTILTNIGILNTAITALNDISTSDVLLKVNEALDAGNSANPIPNAETGSIRDWIQGCISILKLKKIETDILQTIVKENGADVYGTRSISTTLTDTNVGKLT